MRTSVRYARNRVGETSMDKVVHSIAGAVSDIECGSRIAVGGFGIVGTPFALIRAVLESGVTDLHVVSNNCGVPGVGLGLLVEAGRIRQATVSFIGTNQDLVRQMLSGEVDTELVPQGTLAERLRAAGAGIGAFYTPTGVGTQVSEGGLPVRYGADGSVERTSPAKLTQTFDGREMVLERALPCDFALVHAYQGDRHGNLVFRRTARNFNPVCAMAGRVTIAEVEHLLDVGELDADAIHLPGVFVHRVVPLTDVEKPPEKTIDSVPAKGILNDMDA